MPATTFTGRASRRCDLVAALNRFKERIWYIHLKDLEPNVARRTREEEWDYFTAMRNGAISANSAKDASTSLPCCAGLRRATTKGYVLVEQDILPGMGTPKESARRNREYLRSIEANFTERQPLAVSR